MILIVLQSEHGKQVGKLGEFKSDSSTHAFLFTKVRSEILQGDRN